MLKPRSVAVVFLLAALTKWTITENMDGPLSVVQREIGVRWHLSARRFGRLSSGAIENHPFALRAGMAYQLVAVCDENCSELSFALFDENGREVDRDVRRHTWPSLQVTPVRSATFELQVSMAGCRQAPCAYAVALFSDGR